MPIAPDEDELEELPPLDGDARDAPEPAAGADDLDVPAGEASLDDTTGEGDPVDAAELEVDETDTGWVDEPSDAKDLDLGDPDMAVFSEEPLSPADAEEPAIGDEDYGFGQAPEHGGLDAGEDGPVDPDEELRAEDLPALDADEEGDVEEASLVDPGFAADEPLGLPWADAPWERVGAPVGLVSASAVVCAARGAIAAGRAEGGDAVLVRVDLEGASQALAAAGLDVASVRVLSADGPAIAVVDDGGAVLLSRDGGERFEMLVVPDVAADVVVVGERVWAQTVAGKLLAVPVGAGSIQIWDKLAIIEALVVDPTGHAVALETDVASGRFHAVAFFREDGTVRRELGGAELRMPPVLAKRGRVLAYAARQGGIARNVLGQAWTLHPWSGHVTAIAVLDEAGTVLAASYSDADDTTALVRVDPAGRAAVVARIGPSRHDPDCDGRVVSMAHDEARGVVWLAGAFGLAAFAVG